MTTKAISSYQSYEAICTRLDYEKKLHCNVNGEPALYVGTYNAYNNGSLYGEWVNLDSFDTVEEFYDFCRLLHYMDDDPEFMFQDYMNFPREWYSECGMSEETFDKIKEYAQLDDEERQAYEDYIDEVNCNGDIDSFKDNFLGKWESEEEFAEQFARDMHPDLYENEFFWMYFDFKSYARDLFYDYHFTSNGYVFS